MGKNSWACGRKMQVGLKERHAPAIRQSNKIGKACASRTRNYCLGSYVGLAFSRLWSVVLSSLLEMRCLSA
ncbi:hypothetical protein QYF36_011420 [Acer negundo]|nr:hypothetical protein QYF36_011420 [Acer negundo]